MEETLTNAIPSETVKIKTHHARIVVDGTAEKPYYSIEWFDPEKEEYYLGYSSHYIKYVFDWLKECFEIVEKPMTNADRIRAMTDEELAASHLIIPCFYDDDGYGECKYGWHDRKQTCEECKLEWLQQPAEGD